MNKIQEFVVWYGEVDFKTLIFFLLIVFISVLISFIILHDKIPKIETMLK
jgi:hypothetical protein